MRGTEALVTNQNSGSQVLAVTNLQEFFRDALHCALDHQHVKVQQDTEHYVVNLLTLFSRADSLYADAPSRAAHKPLAHLLQEALDAPTLDERRRSLQRMGDLSLFFAGFFAGHFARRLVDIDYHIAMGGRAYGSLADSLERGPRRTLAQVFAELAEKFMPMVDALNEISETAYRHSDRDRLRLYELWAKTGSLRARRLLRSLGIEPVDGASLRASH